jgi:hypothetical protein
MGGLSLAISYFPVQNLMPIMLVAVNLLVTTSLSWSATLRNYEQTEV